MKRFFSGLLLGSIIPAIGIYFAHGSRTVCFEIGLLLPILALCVWPRAICGFILRFCDAWSAVRTSDAKKQVKEVPKALTQLEQDVVSALVNFGMKQAQAERTVQQVRGQAQDFEGLLKACVEKRKAA